MTRPSWSCSSTPMPYVTESGVCLEYIAVPEYPFFSAEFQYDV